MQVYRYLEEDTARFALTRDVGGARLPTFGAVWLYAGTAQLGSDQLGCVGLEPSAVKAEILRKGYFLWPDDIARVMAEPRAFGR